MYYQAYIEKVLTWMTLMKQMLSSSTYRYATQGDLVKFALFDSSSCRLFCPKWSYLPLGLEWEAGTVESESSYWQAWIYLVGNEHSSLHVTFAVLYVRPLDWGGGGEVFAEISLLAVFPWLTSPGTRWSKIIYTRHAIQVIEARMKTV